MKNCREMVEVRDLRDAFAEVDRNPHPKLWRMIAESALEKRDYDIAHKAFVKCDDYHGISFTKKLKRLDDA